MNVVLLASAKTTVCTVVFGLLSDVTNCPFVKTKSRVSIIKVFYTLFLKIYITDLKCILFCNKYVTVRPFLECMCKDVL